MHVNTHKSSRKQWVALAILLVWFGFLVWVVLNRQAVWDWWKLRAYHAPAAVVALAADDTMTPYGRHVFYVNAPQLESKSAFNGKCPIGHEQTVVLGCYHGGQNGIYLLSVTDERLNGIEQVTAAHEMLHAAYDRLSSSEKKSVDAMLTDYFGHDLHDQTIIDQINGYKKSEPKELVNEMHSIFGTEIANLPTPLEQYYQKYFTDRSKIVGYYTAYESAFTSRQAQVATYDAQLAALKPRIDADEQQAQTQAATLQAEYQQLQAERTSGNTDAYNAGVPSYNAAVGSYNELVAQIHQLVAQYNQIVDARNVIALEEQQLVNDISSTVSPIAQ